MGLNKDLSADLQVPGALHQAVRQSGEENACEDILLVRTTQAIDCAQVHTLQHGTAPSSGTACTKLLLPFLVKMLERSWDNPNIEWE